MFSASVFAEYLMKEIIFPIFFQEYEHKMMIYNHLYQKILNQILQYFHQFLRSSHLHFVGLPDISVSKKQHLNHLY